MTLLGAEAALAESPAYTYVIYPRTSERGFTISFINKHGFVEHHPLTLISLKQGIWRNGHPPHIGKLEKVISDVLGHNEGQPLL